ncbi:MULTISPECIES: hypothetical protein [Streptomyces]|uniref:Secreted protein n=1 Tax=Streptomyces avermitilis TaxID=33903 RepID=A0A4D4LS54_STRAX|nr:MULTISPECIES: hypothetical protein [Streptomyces]MYS99960.1 hypothetical protein [Streptomyces sp. SID5469]GDY64411.1 hypothetical protein SAV14893_038040 [Streptomyces avermitilis]
MTPRTRTTRTLRTAVRPLLLSTGAALAVYATTTAYVTPPAYAAAVRYALTPASPAAVRYAPAHPSAAAVPYAPAQPSTAAAPSPLPPSSLAVATASSPPAAPTAAAPSRLAPAEQADQADPAEPADPAAAATRPVPSRDAATPSRGAVGAPGRPTPDPSRAGSQAGEGRMRPGRADDGSESEDAEPTYTDRDPADGDAEESGVDPGASVRPEVTDAPQPSQHAAATPPQSVVRPGERTPKPVLEVLPLGSGLILMGLGLGLAFLALRVRRG